MPGTEVFVSEPVSSESLVVDLCRALKFEFLFKKKNCILSS